MSPMQEHAVRRDLVARGIDDPRVLDAFRHVPREQFVARDLADLAYVDSPLAIGEGQTISQPYIVALTAQALKLSGAERVLEVGTGSGYAAAVFSLLAREVFTVERYASLANEATERLARLGHANVHVHVRDGTLGWPEHAPYDAIAVAAAGPRVPRALLAQLAIGGRLVMPVGVERHHQTLVRITHVARGDFRQESLLPVSFVPLIGAEGWPDDDDAQPAYH